MESRGILLDKRLKWIAPGGDMTKETGLGYTVEAEVGRLLVAGLLVGTDGGALGYVLEPGGIVALLGIPGTPVKVFWMICFKGISGLPV